MSPAKPPPSPGYSETDELFDPKGLPTATVDAVGHTEGSATKYVVTLLVHVLDRDEHIIVALDADDIAAIAKSAEIADTTRRRVN